LTDAKENQMQQTRLIQATLLAMVLGSSWVIPALAAGAAACEDQKMVYP
jgi:hypothetical protein